MAYIIFFQSNPHFSDDLEELILALDVMGLKQSDDYLLKCCPDHTWALNALSAGRRQLFFSSTGGSRLRPQERCALVKDLNPAALFVTLSIFMPTEEEKAGIDGWVKRPRYGDASWLPLQLGIHGFLQQLPDADFMHWFRQA